MSETRPWHNHTALCNTLASWRQSWSGRTLFRVSAGPGWLRLHLEGDERPGLFLIAMPAANLIFSTTGPLPEALRRALSPTPRHPVQRLLSGCRLDSVGMLPNDNVAALRFTDTQGHQFFLLHRLFGSRSNTVILDSGHQLHWSLHRPPHPLLSEIPKPATWKTGEAGGQDNISEAAQGQLIARLAHDLQVGIQTRLYRQKQSAGRLVENLEKDLKNANRGIEYRRKAEALAANLYRIQQGLPTFETVDLRDGLPLSIPLNPALSPAENMNALFKKASKAEKGRQIIQDRLQEAESKNERLIAIATSWTGLVAGMTGSDDLLHLGELQEWVQQYPDFLPTHKESGGRRDKSQGASQETRPFRRYLIDNHWEVWVGRNNKENDSLTHQASNPKDLWFHAQGVPGSHVILRTAGKTDNIPRTVLEKAAALAALHSKAKHSAYVPVIWTERRFVRKPRKTPAGTAVCIQEKSLFVEPGISEGVELAG